VPPGWVVCSVPMEPDPVLEPVPVVVVAPVWPEFVPVEFVPVVLWELPVVLGVAGLGVTEPVLPVLPVLCAVAIPTDSANTDVASKIFRIEGCSL
jgi:hypothetical protein